MNSATGYNQEPFSRYQCTAKKMGRYQDIKCHEEMGRRQKNQSASRSHLWRIHGRFSYIKTGRNDRIEKKKRNVTYPWEQSSLTVGRSA
jgi:hypothetical protein